MSWWQNAQQYERHATAEWLQQHGKQSKSPPLPAEFFCHPTLGGRHREELVEHSADKTCLEVGPAVRTALTGLPAKQFIIVEPMADQFGDTLYLPPNSVLHAQPGEEALPQYFGQIDGVICDRNCIDHAEDPLWLLDRICNCAAPGCWLMHWSDIWHYPDADSGHRNITENPKDIRDFIAYRKFEIVYEFTSRFPDYSHLMDYGCLARKT